MPTATPLPSGISPPYGVINDTDQSGLIAILAGFALGLTLLSAGIRLYPRHHIDIYRWDDWTFHAATIVAVIQAILVFEQIALGLGKELSAISDTGLTSIRDLGLGADLLYILILYLSKSSCACFLLWLTPYEIHQKFVWGLIVVSGVFGITSLFVEGFRCTPGYDESPLQCTNFFGRWVFVGLCDMLVEVALIAASLYLIWGRQMAWKNKLIVVGAFVCRAPNIALTVIRLVFLSRPAKPDVWDSRLASTTQLAIGYTITSCMIPYLGPFMQAYERKPDHYHSSNLSSQNYSKYSRRSSSATAMPPSSEYHFTSVETRRYTTAEEEIKRALEREVRGGSGLMVNKTVDWKVEYDQEKAKTEGKGGMKWTRPEGEVSPEQRQAEEDAILPAPPRESSGSSSERVREDSKPQWV